MSEETDTRKDLDRFRAVQRLAYDCVVGFHPQTFIYLLGHAARRLMNQRKNKTAFWTEDADVPPEPGLWAIEPHIGKDAFGVKFEEILVVTKNDAYWLDDDLPHVNFWGRHGA